MVAGIVTNKSVSENVALLGNTTVSIVVETFATSFTTPEITGVEV